MRKIILGLGISLDGYIARKNGAVDWLSMNWDYDWTAFFKTIDAVLMGRKSWEVALEMTAPEKRSSNPYGAMETYVFSNTLKTSGVDGVEIVSGDLKKFVEMLRAKDGKNLWLSGGGSLAKSFLDENLVATGILASGFADEIRKRHGEEKTCPPCPHCGGDISEVARINSAD